MINNKLFHQNNKSHTQTNKTNNTTNPTPKLPHTTTTGHRRIYRTLKDTKDIWDTILPSW